MKIPYYLVANAPTEKPALEQWVRSNDEIISMIVHEIMKKRQPLKSNGNGRPRLDDDAYIEFLRSIVGSEDRAMTQGSLIAAMMSHRPASETGCRSVLRRLKDRGLIIYGGGEFSWMPKKVWFRNP